MPEKLDKCVAGLLAKWTDDPAKRPKQGKDGKPLKTEADLKSAAFAICRASTKLQAEAQGVTYNGHGPTLLAVGMTAKPHLRQRGHEITVVGEGEKKFARVPLMRKGLYRHPKGRLVFNDDFFQTMIANHQNKVSDYNVHLDLRHGEEQGALAFLDAEDGGRLAVEGDWLVAYGPLADEAAERIISSRRWRYSSPEFHPDYKSHLVKRLSADEVRQLVDQDLLEIDEEDEGASNKATSVRLLFPDHDTKRLVKELNKFLKEKGTMTLKLTIGEKILELEQDKEGLVRLDQEGLETFTSALDAANTALEATKARADKAEEEVKEAKDKVVALEAKVAQLEARLNKDEDDDETDPKVLALEAQVMELKDANLRQKAAGIIAAMSAWRDENGQGHSPFVLETTKALLLKEPLGEGDETIRLEGKGPEDNDRYWREGLIHLWKNFPGLVPMESKTQGQERRLESDNGLGGGWTENLLDEKAKEAWELS